MSPIARKGVKAPNALASVWLHQLFVAIARTSRPSSGPSLAFCLTGPLSPGHSTPHLCVGQSSTPKGHLAVSRSSFHRSSLLALVRLHRILWCLPRRPPGKVRTLPTSIPQAFLYLNCTIPQQLLLLRLRLLRCERPATACGLSAASGRVSRKTSRAAMPAQNETKPMKAINRTNAQLPPAKNMAGWHTLVSSSFSVGPCRHTCLHARSVLPCFGRPTACT